MATITYTFVSRCTGGGHVAMDVSLNGGAANRVVYETDDLRAPLSDLTSEQKTELTLAILKIHLAGKTRAQIVTEFGSPVTVTI